MSRRLLSMQGDRVLTALWDDGRIIECSVDERVPAFLGRIYLAKVDHIVPSISGAFLSAGDQKLYYSLNCCTGDKGSAKDKGTWCWFCPSNWRTILCRYDGAGRKTAKDKDFFVEKDYRGYIS